MKITFDTQKWGHTYALLLYMFCGIVCLNKSLDITHTYLMIVGGVAIFREYVGAFKEAWVNGSVTK